MRILLPGIALLWMCLSCPARAGAGSAGGLVGQNTCDKAFTLSHSGWYQDFDKDPAAFQVGEIIAAGKRYVVAVEKESREKNWCGKIIAAMEVEHPIDNERGEGIEFNCAVLEQPYDRYKLYWSYAPRISRADSYGVEERVFHRLVRLHSAEDLQFRDSASIKVDFGAVALGSISAQQAQFPALTISLELARVEIREPAIDRRYGQL